MDTTEVKKTELLDKLRENKEKHQAEYDQAKQKWRQQATEALQKAAQQAEEGGEINMHPLSALPKPVNFIESYDEAIARVDMDVREVLELDDRQFAAWVLDNWNWHTQFLAATRSYNS